MCYNSKKWEREGKTVSKATQSREKIEMIVGFVVIGMAVVLLIGLIICTKWMANRIEGPAQSPSMSKWQNSTASQPGKQTLIPNPYNARDFANDGAYLTCLSGPCELGVDVSEYQGKIDWEKVAAEGFRFAIIRVGARAWGQTGQILTDTRWQENLTGARQAGLQVGVYFFSQAISEEEAREEARFVLEKLDGQTLDLPVVFDWEFAPDTDARTKNVTPQMLNRCAIAFCQEVSAAGYQPMVYFNLDLAKRMLDLLQMQEMGYPFWLAMYTTNMTYPHRVDMWQYTDEGTVAGINGTVDINLRFFYE